MYPPPPPPHTHLTPPPPPPPNTHTHTHTHTQTRTTKGRLWTETDVLDNVVCLEVVAAREVVRGVADHDREGGEQNPGYLFREKGLVEGH